MVIFDVSGKLLQTPQVMVMLNMVLAIIMDVYAEVPVDVWHRKTGIGIEYTADWVGSTHRLQDQNCL